MSAYIKTLEKQNEILREEVRIHAQAVDALSERLVAALNELKSLRPVDADEDVIIEASSTH